MRFEATSEFVERYRHLDQQTLECVDEALSRLLDEHGGAWARQNRVVGAGGAAWLIALRCRDDDCGLYWREGTADSIVLLLLIRR